MIPTRVDADEREKASGVPAELSKQNVRVYFSKLPVGDYVLSPDIAVERKTVKDFVSSIYDSRIFYQSARLSASFAKPYLLLEGLSSDVEGLVRSLRSYYGAIANVTLAYNLRVIYTANQSETAIAIAELLHHARARPLSRIPNEMPQKGKTTSARQLYLVSSLPGIGRRLAEKLLLKYGTPRKVLSLTTGELAMTAGIGWKRAEKVKGILDTMFSNSQETHKQTRLEP